MNSYEDMQQRAERHGIYVTKNVKIIALYAVCLGAFGVFFAALVAGSIPGLGIVAMAALSCFAIGSAFGFLFSIPKSAQSPGPLQKSPADDTHESDEIPRDNTNLEQISDWFVKILIGASLVQLNTVKDIFEHLATKLSRCLLLARQEGPLPLAPGPEVEPFCQPFCLFLIFYFLTLGFLAGYLITRLWLPFVILKSGLAMKSAQKASHLENLSQKIDRLEIEDGNLTSLQDALDVLRYALRGFEGDKIAPDQAAIRLALERFKQCQGLFPTHRTLAILGGRLFRELKRYDDAIAVMRQYLEEFKRTGKKPDADYAAVLYNQACYLNLKAQQSAQPEEAKALRQMALQCVHESEQIDPENAREAKTDPDLETLFQGSQAGG